MTSVLGKDKTLAADYNELLSVTDYIKKMEYLGVDFGFTSDEQTKIAKINDVFESLQYMSKDNNKLILSRLSERILTKIGELETSLEKGDTDYKKWAFYIGHYQTLWSLLSRIGMTSSDCLMKNYQDKPVVPCESKPAFNSHMFLTLYQESTLGKDIFVRAVYNGVDITSNLKGCYADGRCALDGFKSSYLAKGDVMTTDEIDRKCGNYDVNLAGKLWALIGASVLFSVIMIIVFITTLKKKLKKK